MKNAILTKTLASECKAVIANVNIINIINIIENKGANISQSRVLSTELAPKDKAENQQKAEVEAIKSIGIFSFKFSLEIAFPLVFSNTRITYL